MTRVLITDQAQIDIVKMENPEFIIQNPDELHSEAHGFIMRANPNTDTGPDTDPERAPLFLPMAEQNKRPDGTAEPFRVARPDAVSGFNAGFVFFPRHFDLTGSRGTCRAHECLTQQERKPATSRT
jgi:hypothetical protein